MYILDATTRSLHATILNASDGTFSFATSYVLLGENTFTAHTQFGTLTYNVPTTILSSPPANTQSQLKFFSLYNPTGTSNQALI